MPGWIGLPELLGLSVLLTVVFGPTRLPDIGRNLGKSVREFKKSVSGREGQTGPASSDQRRPVD